MTLSACFENKIDAEELPTNIENEIGNDVIYNIMKSSDRCQHQFICRCDEDLLNQDKYDLETIKFNLL